MKPYKKLKINQAENYIIRKFCSECVAGIIDDSDYDKNPERFHGLDLPLIAIMSDVVLCLDFVKVEYVDPKKIPCDPSKIMQYIDFRLKHKSYKSITYRNNSLISYIKYFFDEFMRISYNESLARYIEVITEATEKVSNKNTNEPTIH